MIRKRRKNGKKHSEGEKGERKQGEPDYALCLIGGKRGGKSMQNDGEN